MKIRISCLCILLLVLTGGASFAQNSIFAGKITDENDKPVTGARIIISHARQLVAETVADADGLYYTQLLPSGYYNIDVKANGKYIKSKKVNLKPQDKVRWYYNLQLVDEKIEVTVSAHDPFMATKLGKIEAEPVQWDFGGNRIEFFRTDPTGKLITEMSHVVIEAPSGIKSK